LDALGVGNPKRGRATGRLKGKKRRGNLKSSPSSREGDAGSKQSVRRRPGKELTGRDTGLGKKKKHIKGETGGTLGRECRKSRKDWPRVRMGGQAVDLGGGDRENWP